MIKTTDDKSKFFYLTSGNWSTVVNADDRSSALRVAFNELLDNKSEYCLGPVIICFDVDVAVRELSLEQSLKFVPTEDALEEIGEPRIALAIKTFFGYE